MTDQPDISKSFLAAAIGVLAAWAAGILIMPLIGDRMPFITYFPMVFVLAWWGGFRPTLFGTLLTALLLVYTELLPAGSDLEAIYEFRFSLVLFVGVALATGWLGENLHASRRAAQEATRRAVCEREQLSVNVAQRQLAQQGVAFLAEASKSLAALADRESALQQAVRLPIPFLADWCVIYVVDDHGAIDYHAHAHRDPAKEPLLNRMLTISPLDWSSNTATVRSLRTGQSQLMAELSEPFLDSVAQSEQHREFIRVLGPRSVISVPLKIRDRIIGVMGLVSCDDRRKYTQHEVRLAEGLAERISTAVDNARLFHAVKEANRQKDEFLAMLAHELRNPLAAIRYSIALGQLSPADASGELFEIIDRQTQNLARLIDDLLDVSRISRDKISLRRQVVDLEKVVHAALTTARPVLDQKQHELVVDISPQPMPVDVDSTRAEQIVANLLTNAAKYTHSQGRITLQVYPDGDTAVVKVIDTGIGIPPEMLGRVFDLFAQADRSLDRAEGGLGIGLTVARRLAEMHGGNISVASDGIGKGSTFTAQLPLATGLPQQSTDGAKPAGVAEQKLRILVVDDNRDTAITCARMLRLVGHQVDVAHEGKAALEQARHFNPQVLLLDIGLPGMNGYEVARTLRKEGFERQTMIAISGYGQPEDRHRSREAGFNHHLVKPVEQSQLVALLAQVDTAEPTLQQ